MDSSNIIRKVGLLQKTVVYYQALAEKDFVSSDSKKYRNNAQKLYYQLEGSIKTALSDTYDPDTKVFELALSDSKVSFSNKISLISQLLNKVLAFYQNEPNQNKLLTTKNNDQSEAGYISGKQIAGFVKKNDGWNYKKLISLIQELNFNHKNNKVYASLNLIRAITDHIPPLLGHTYFSEVVNNYKWQPTEARYMQKLHDDRNISDSSLHKIISESEDILDMDSIPNPTYLRRLLQECIDKTIKPNEIAKKAVQKEKRDQPVKKDISVNSDVVILAKIAGMSGSARGYEVSIEISNCSSTPVFIVSAKMGDVENRIASLPLTKEDRPILITFNLTTSKLRTLGYNPVLYIDYINIQQEKKSSVFDINSEYEGQLPFSVSSLSGFRVVATKDK